jgi:hypothetical protein
LASNRGVFCMDISWLLHSERWNRDWRKKVWSVEAGYEQISRKNHKWKNGQPEKSLYSTCTVSVVLYTLNLLSRSHGEDCDQACLRLIPLDSPTLQPSYPSRASVNSLGLASRNGRHPKVHLLIDISGSRLWDDIQVSRCGDASSCNKSKEGREFAEPQASCTIELYSQRLNLHAGKVVQI